MKKVMKKNREPSWEKGQPMVPEETHNSKNGMPSQEDATTRNNKDFTKAIVNLAKKEPNQDQNRTTDRDGKDFQRAMVNLARKDKDN